MRIKYLKNGQQFAIDESNADVILEEKKVGQRTTIVLTAQEEVELDQAELFIPFTLNNEDLYFLNGYQSWTDTKEFKLSKVLCELLNLQE